MLSPARRAHDRKGSSRCRWVWRQAGATWWQLGRDGRCRDLPNAATFARAARTAEHQRSFYERSRDRYLPASAPRRSREGCAQLQPSDGAPIPEWGNRWQAETCRANGLATAPATTIRREEYGRACRARSESSNANPG